MKEGRMPLTKLKIVLGKILKSIHSNYEAEFILEIYPSAFQEYKSKS